MLVRPAGYDVCAATQRGLNRAPAAGGFDDATSGSGWDAKEPGADIAGADWSRRNQGHNRRLRDWCDSNIEAYDEIAMNKVVPSSGYGGPSSADKRYEKNVSSRRALSRIMLVRALLGGRAARQLFGTGL